MIQNNYSTNSNSSQSQNNQTNCQKDQEGFFGFKRILQSQKAQLVEEVFSSVASSYDIMNDAMSLGLHRHWKNIMTNKILNIAINHQNSLDFNQKINIIDIAAGSGDIAINLHQKLQKNNISHHITISDINQKMLNLAIAKIVDKNMFNSFNFLCADGQNLPFEDNSFDIVTISFGIRNFSNIEAGIKEFYRILKKGGHLICLEFSRVNNFWLQKIYYYYSYKIIHKIGKLIAKDEASYQYLVESIAKFPNQNSFQEIVKNCGFNNCNFSNLNFGVATIYSAQK